MNCDVIVIGGGAAGLMCAIEAGKRKRRVVALEHGERLGKKDPDLRRGPMQLHQHRRHGSQLRYQRQPAFLQVGTGTIHPFGFHRTR